MFTKGVGPLKFKPLRDLLMGWTDGAPELLNHGVRKGELKDSHSTNGGRPDPEPPDGSDSGTSKTPNG